MTNATMTITNEDTMVQDFLDKHNCKKSANN